MVILREDSVYQMCQMSCENLLKEKYQYMVYESALEKYGFCQSGENWLYLANSGNQSKFDLCWYTHKSDYN